MSTSILIIDANWRMLERSKALWRSKGMAPRSPSLARRASPGEPHAARVVMIDSFLPDRDWREVATDLRQGPCGAKTSIVMLAEAISDGQPDGWQPSPADDVLIKPFATAEVSAKLTRDPRGERHAGQGAVVSTGNAELDSRWAVASRSAP